MAVHGVPAADCSGVAWCNRSNAQRHQGEGNHSRRHGRNTDGLVANQIIPKQFYKHLVQIFFLWGRVREEVERNLKFRAIVY